MLLPSTNYHSFPKPPKILKTPKIPIPTPQPIPLPEYPPYRPRLPLQAPPWHTPAELRAAGLHQRSGIRTAQLGSFRLFLKTDWRVTHYLVTALYILAAVRAVVPNLCQTQRQALEQIRAQSCCSAGSDCDTPAPLPDGQFGLAKQPKPHIPCPLCLLAATLQEPLTTVHPQPILAASATLQLPPDLLILPRTPVQPWLGRSPPSC